ncbi:Transcriptional regulatory protein, C terminal [Cedecea neteri]|uniref:Transcriptional regulatory protein, C terminal n=1 Tax=Cedecea neteri TaxID=158822 RepID=A0A291E369_9ENTR|nr:helix-turn-helix domain-containing protein [Cedecea neteri]ATF94524.1 winged helix family transcriptional regulator [Cedecea neteri]SQA97966.1 Transcriptional regulatory protein, C terminal [Cedecea neteri]
MRYLIDKKMVVTEDGVTTPGLESTEHELSSLPYRLLCFFIANNNRLVTREEIFHHIWESHDLSPSGTALATQVSSLRKIMSGYGIADNTLLTKPRQGFIFTASVEAVTEQEPEAAWRQNINFHRGWFLGIGVIISLGIFVYGLYVWLTENEHIPWHRIGAVKSCAVYVLDDDMSPSVTSYYLRKAEEYRADNRLVCNTQDKILEYIQHPGISEINDIYETKQFYAYCRWMKESYICNNTYYSAGKTN